MSAPVFQTVAQEVLEYLGVPHDQPVKTQKELLAAAPETMPGDGPSESADDLNRMFDAINNLPADDPLRKSSGAVADASGEQASVLHGIGSAPQSLHAADPLRRRCWRHSAADDGAKATMADAAPRAPIVAPQIQPRANGAVVVDAGQRVAVPSFTGDGLRGVVEMAAGLGLRVQPMGIAASRAIRLRRLGRWSQWGRRWLCASRDSWASLYKQARP